MASRTLMIVAAANVTAVLAHMLPAHGQVGGVDPLPDPPLPAPNQTIPEQIYPCNPGNYRPDADAVPDVPAAIDCGEVIVPPPGVDAEIAVPPPDPYAGTTPVIPPSDIEKPQP